MPKPALILKLGAGVRTLEVPGQGLIDLLPLVSKLPDRRPRSSGEAQRQEKVKDTVFSELAGIIAQANAGLFKLGFFRHNRPAMGGAS